MKLLEYFEQSYIINLPIRQDRLKQITQELAKQGINLTSDHIDIFEGIRPTEPQGFPNIGSRGCFLSHLQILKQAQKKQLNNILILEDDLAFAPFFQKEQENIVEQLRSSNWGFVYLSHREQVTATSPVSLSPYSDSVLTTGFYGVNGTIIEPLINFLEQLLTRPAGHPDGGPMHIDGAYSTFRKKHPEILTLISCPTIAWQSSSRSDISPNFYDQIPVIREAATQLRKVKRWLR
ncbi:LPS biosynthesis glycosyltransferase [Aphanothece hegewaldii CCALA 016]|uniref:LPS biosynthesis glycosyltransferase n=1 Tax=Aphanothece hegewaldii CCALA 016 TaxID=2107694 RepID=A0A2T1LYR6_9CHRO|nr:glycosyltransferase family 25 protein [Aphanothece hegewaldii]PSF37543.1 LPS biosynthesis glycosyltransferase [Aphanothece hegewaldii CCALA 016]